MILIPLLLHIEMGIHGCFFTIKFQSNIVDTNILTEMRNRSFRRSYR